MAYQLSEGTIKKIFSGEQVVKPIFQILGFKKIPGAGSDRYRLLISDGATVCPFVMLASQLNNLVPSGQLEKFTVVQVNKYICNTVQPEKRVIIFLEVHIIAPGSEVGEKIGNPAQTAVYPGASESSVPNGGMPMNESSSASRPAPMAFGGVSTSVAPPVANVHPISSLTPYQNRWTIRARVTNKTPIRTWNNSRGEGKLFSMDLLDESGEIRATAFNDAVDKFFDMIEVNKVYYISRASLKTANKQYTSIKNDYEMSFNADTTVASCEENSSSIPMLQFDFIPIQKLEEVAKDSSVDVIGVCKSTSELQTVIARSTNRELRKKEIHLVDRSNTEVSLTLWANEAEKFDGSSNPIVAVKGAKVSDFGGRSLSTLTSSVLQINPDIKEAHVLRGWFDREGRDTESQSISGKVGSAAGAFGGSWKTFAQAKCEMLGMGDKPDYYTTKATVVMIRKENCMYMSCPSSECNKKVIDMNNGMFRCEKCSREYDSFSWRLLLSLSIADFSDHQWVTCFHEGAEALLNITGQELGMLKESNEDRYNEVLTEANFKSYIFKLRTKMEMFNDENRLKTHVVSASPVEPLKYAQKLLNDIKDMEGHL